MPPSFVFFGTPEFALIVLEELEKASLTPALVVTTPDKPRGRGLVVTPPEVKEWAEKRNIPVIQPTTLNQDAIEKIKAVGATLAVVTAYGKIIPETLIHVFPKGILNVHPSLLPKFRGASPVESAILSGEKETGVSIMQIDEKLDHGGVFTEEKVVLHGTERTSTLEKDLARRGGKLLARVIPEWLSGRLLPTPQDDTKATVTKKLTKEDGLVDPSGGEETFRKFRAYDVWPRTYFFRENKDGSKTRVVITDATLENGVFTPLRVIPEGKNEITYRDFLKNS